MMTSRFKRYKVPRWMTTQIRIGSPNLSMLAQVKFPINVSQIIETDQGDRLPNEQAQ
jgi:hypothetical protein